MRRTLLFVCVTSLLSAINLSAKETIYPMSFVTNFENDTSRIIELDQYWEDVSRTVSEGDFEGYASLYHKDAVVVFATSQSKSSLSISKALAGWKQGFEETKAGKANSTVRFRLSQRINDETTAHETGIFHYSSLGNDGSTSASSYIHFEMLLVKKDGQWLGLMEYQKLGATKEEWESLD